MFIFKEKKSKGLGEGCDPRVRMNQCNEGLHCYQKSDNLVDGMCVPMCKNEGYFNRRKRGMITNKGYLIIVVFLPYDQLDRWCD